MRELTEYLDKELDDDKLYEYRIDDLSMQGDRVEFLLTIILYGEDNLIPLSRWRIVCEYCCGIYIDRCDIHRDFRLRYGLLMIGRSSFKGTHFSCKRLGDLS
jgi:hypothetical protein